MTLSRSLACSQTCLVFCDIRRTIYIYRERERCERTKEGGQKRGRGREDGVFEILVFEETSFALQERGQSP